MTAVLPGPVPQGRSVRRGGASSVRLICVMPGLTSLAAIAPNAMPTTRYVNLLNYGMRLATERPSSAHALRGCLHATRSCLHALRGCLNEARRKRLPRLLESVLPPTVDRALNEPVEQRRGCERKQQGEICSCRGLGLQDPSEQEMADIERV